MGEIMSLEELKKKLFNAIVEGDGDSAKRIAREIVDKYGYDVKALITDVLTPAMRKVGELFEKGEYFIADLVICAEAFKSVIDDVIRPRLRGEKIPVKAIAVFGTVRGDIHEIGKNIAKIVFETEGFEVIDLGVDVPPEKFVDEAIKAGARIIGASALLTTTMIEQKKIIDELKKRGIRDRFIVIAGGAPVTDEWVREIGADVNGNDVFRALREVKRILGVE